MAAIPAYASTPKLGRGIVTTSDTSRTAPTGVTIFTAGAAGSRIDRIQLTGIGATTATTVRLFIHDGTSYFLWQEVAITAVTPSATVQVFSTNLTTPNNVALLPLVLPTGYSLRATINDTQAGGGVNILASGGDF